jgi:hypothetical protein
LEIKMATSPALNQNRPNAAAIAATLANQAAQTAQDTAKLAGAGAVTNKKLTFRHLVSGSTYIMPSGKVLQFIGPKGGVGDYVTDDQYEIEELMKISRVGNVPMELIVSKPMTEVAEIPTTISKTVETAAMDDANASAERANKPEVVAAQAALGKLIASGTAADGVAQAPV